MQLTIHGHRRGQLVGPVERRLTVPPASHFDLVSHATAGAHLNVFPQGVIPACAPHVDASVKSEESVVGNWSNNRRIPVGFDPFQDIGEDGVGASPLRDGFAKSSDGRLDLVLEIRAWYQRQNGFDQRYDLGLGDASSLLFNERESPLRPDGGDEDGQKLVVADAPFQHGNESQRLGFGQFEGCRHGHSTPERILAMVSASASSSDATIVFVVMTGGVVVPALVERSHLSTHVMRDGSDTGVPS